MSILINKDTKVITQGITGKTGMFHTSKCREYANGVIAAAKETKLSVPLVVRMKGTNEDLGRQILRDSGLPIISADNMADAAQKIVAAVGGR
jgi:succinyl-CoA synthetase beta subunit